MAVLTAVQTIADSFLFFIPFYYTAKLALFYYLWMNNMEGSVLVYNRYLAPFVHTYEAYVDQKISRVKVLMSFFVTSKVSKCVKYLQDLAMKAMNTHSKDRKASQHPCCVCLSNSPRMLMSECYHLCLCEECAGESIESCPICRTAGVPMRVYF